MNFLNLVLILTLIGSSCAIAHGENIVAYCISNSKYYSLPQTITADVAIDGVSLGRDYTIKMIVENGLYAKHRSDDKRVTSAEGTQTKNCGGTHGGWMWFRSGNAVQVRLPQDAVPGCYDITIELYSGRSAQPQNLLDKEYIPEQFCAWTNGQPDPDEAVHPNNACSLADEPDTPTDTSLCVPQLISPAEGGIMPNCNAYSTAIWDFKWSEVPGASMYEISIMGGHNFEIETQQPSFHYEPNGRFCISDDKRFNYVWKVKAYVNGQWCDYSQERHFDVAPQLGRDLPRSLQW
jgi:hypothetical protein